MIRLSIFYKKPGWIKGSCIVFAESDKTFVRKAVFRVTRDAHKQAEL